MTDLQMKLRPRKKKLNYNENGIRESPAIPFSRESCAERKLRPIKLITYQDQYQDQSSSLQLSNSDSECSISDGNQKWFSKQSKKRKRRTKKNLQARLSVQLNCDTTDDGDEYTSMREKNTVKRFNILKDMGLLNRGRGGRKRSKVMQKCTTSDMAEKNSDVVDAKEEENELTSTPNSGNEDEEEYTTQRKIRIAERCQNLRTMAKEEKMYQKVNMITSTPIILLPRIRIPE